MILSGCGYIPQNVIEQILREQLAALGGEIEWKYLRWRPGPFHRSLEPRRGCGE
ncbi:MULTISPECIES: hypothetical protein [Nocardia]|uniref:hypothetical protein n=1 Tax=Nocardia TaxID=1817 RepID=UPI0013594B8F|nr:MULTISPECIES: hypothetical protein [Nocardia]